MVDHRSIDPLALPCAHCHHRRPPSIPSIIVDHPITSRQDRINAVNQFKSKEIPLLVATDVAARGLDIPDVEVVINYSFPCVVRPRLLLFERSYSN